MIDSRYNDVNLCLKTIASDLNVNPSYLGRQFKAEIGEYFNDYLSRIRIRSAEKLLKTTDMKIAEISAAVGFSSMNYFGNVYKKMMLCTPGETRRIRQNNWLFTENCGIRGKQSAKRDSE